MLVTDQDAAPVVKVIDFGVAKALEGSLTEQTVVTGSFQVAGTPLYMSPEQAELHNEPQIDVRSDVYSLGVLLYELLVSTPPIDRQEARKMGVDELRRRICSQPPPRASQRLAAMHQDLDWIAYQRRTAPRQLVRSISRELDWIVMRAIEQDRQRR